MAEKMMVVAAHTGDFVWRAGGSIAKYVREGAEVCIVALSDGLVGEAGSYWKKEGATWEEGSRIRQEEAQAAADVLLNGTGEYIFMNWKDHPLEIDSARRNELITLIRKFQPDFIIGQDLVEDAFNPDHNAAAKATLEASCFARSAGRQDGLQKLSAALPYFGMEPQNSEMCSFKPGIYIDISDVFDIKVEAMKCVATQKAMCDKWIAKGVLRGIEDASRCRRKGCKYAEAFATYLPIGASGRFIY